MTTSGQISAETMVIITGVQNNFFLEKGVVEEVTADNITFYSEFLRKKLEWWNTMRCYRVVYRSDGNDIVKYHSQYLQAVRSCFKTIPTSQYSDISYHLKPNKKGSFSVTIGGIRTVESETEDGKYLYRNSSR